MAASPAKESTMPILIPKPEQQEAFFADRLEAGESINAAFWCEQRLPFLVQWLIDQTPMGALVFSKMRHRYFMALTDRRLLVMGSTGMHKPIPQNFEAIPVAAAACSQFTNWLGHVAMDVSVDGQPRRYRVPRSQRQVAENMRSLVAPAV
jgi:hypothetical protein